MKLELHRVEDWEALYVDGICVRQAHSDTLQEWITHEDTELPLVISEIKSHYHEGDAIDDLVMRCGRFPKLLSDLPTGK